MSFWESLDPRYRVLLCDIWGVVHNGVKLYPGTAARLREWRSEGRMVILITNAPRPADLVAAQLARIGLPRECWDAISTSGEAGIAALIVLADNRVSLARARTARSSKRTACASPTAAMSSLP